MGHSPVIRNFSCCLVHVPDFVCHGSKPRREIRKKPQVEQEIAAALRSYEKAVWYPPNQTFVGNITPDELAEIPRPWFEVPQSLEKIALQKQGRFGEILDQ